MSTLYPPRTITDAQAFARTGDASALGLVRVTHKSFGGCSKPNYFATVSRTIRGAQLAADELSFFQQREPLNRGDCSAFLYVFHTAAEASSPGYTAGAVIDDAQLLQVHTGGLGSAPAFEVSY